MDAHRNFNLDLEWLLLEPTLREGVGYTRGAKERPWALCLTPCIHAKAGSNGVGPRSSGAGCGLLLRSLEHPERDVLPLSSPALMHICTHTNIDR